MKKDAIALPLLPFTDEEEAALVERLTAMDSIALGHYVASAKLSLSNKALDPSWQPRITLGLKRAEEVLLAQSLMEPVVAEAPPVAVAKTAKAKSAKAKAVEAQPSPPRGGVLPASGTALSFSPAADRNKAPILDVLEGLLPAQAAVLEIASGTGQHATHFAAAHPLWTWQPTDADAASLAAIAARTSGVANVREPLHLDVLAQRWPQMPGPFDAVYCANLLHISAWPVCAALMRGAAQHLVAGGVLVLYGPYLVKGEALAPSNAIFDTDLRRRNPGWGLRPLEQVVDAAQRAGLASDGRWAMAANNLMLAFRKIAATG